MPYELRSYDLDGGKSMLVLAAVGSKSFIEKLIERPKLESRVTRILKIAERIESGGIGWGIETQKLKLIDDSLALYETRVGDTTIRIMTYLHEKERAVYLFDFEGHQGKRSNIPEKFLEKGRRLAGEARRCMEQEETNGN